MPRVLQTNFLNYGPTLVPKMITVNQAFNKHSLATIEYEINTPVQYVMPTGDSPVQVNWGLSPVGVRSFYGYTNHYETLSDRVGFANVRLFVLGTSSKMNAVIPESWPGITRSGVAREIAKRHRLRSIIHPHPTVVENWTTGVKSDFQALQTLSEETGYRCWVDGSTLYFLDPQRLLVTSQRQTIPSFYGNSIRSARVLGGAAAPTQYGAKTRKSLYGLDYRTNEFFEATSGDSSHPTQVITNTASTYTEAETLLEAHENNTSAYYTVEALLDGDSSVVPGTLIQLGNKKAVNDLAGYWSVVSAEHVISRQDFSTRVVAIRNEDQTPGILTTTTLLGTPEITSAVIRDGSTWEAELQEHINV